MAGRNQWGERIGAILFGLALLAAVWWYRRLDWVITATIAALIIVSGLLPPRIGSFVGAIGWFVVAGVMYFYYGAPGDRQLAGLVAVIGVIFLCSAVAREMRARRAGGREES